MKLVVLILHCMIVALLDIADHLLGTFMYGRCSIKVSHTIIGATGALGRRIVAVSCETIKRMIDGLYAVLTARQGLQCIHDCIAHGSTDQMLEKDSLASHMRSTIG